jgi:flagellar motor switch protein FliN
MSDGAERGSSRFVEMWAQIMAQVLGEIAGSPVPCAARFESPAGLTAVSATDLWIAAACSGGLRGEMGMRLPPGSAVHLARLFIGEPSAQAAEITSDQREAVAELIRQVGGLLATAIKQVWGEVQLRPELASGPPSWPASSTAWIRIGEPDPAAWIELHLSAALMAALRAEPIESAPGPQATAPLAAAPSSDASGSPAGPVPLDLLMDVELAVTLRFGSRNLLLREVLDLHSGSVIDLDRQVQDPVDMLLDGRVVARGELVVMDGNYGLRVTEVAPPSGTGA